MIESAAAAPPSDPRLTWENASPSALRVGTREHQEWDRLNASHGDLPFLSADAMAVALDVFGSGAERLLIGRKGTIVVAMLVLVPEGRLRWRTFQPSQIPLGAFVAASGVRLTALADSLIKGPLGFCLALSITQVDPRFAPPEMDAANAKHSDYIETGWVNVEGNFEAYWSARGKNLRQNMRKQRKKLESEGTSTSMKVWGEAEQMAPALARYGAMESAGWKAGRGTAIHLDNDQGRFYRRLFEDAARRGEALVYEYLFDDRTVAMNLCLQRNGVLIVLKTTYDESIKSLSPAFLLREEELQEIFAGGRFKRIEYYGRLMDWHTKLTENKRMLYHLTTYRWPLIKQLANSRRRRSERVAESEAVGSE